MRPFGENQNGKNKNVTQHSSQYHCNVNPISRSKGRSSTAAASYRAGCVIADKRTGEIHDYTKRSGVDSAHIVLPDGAPEWATDREKLWNAAELSEGRVDSCVARECQVSLPCELSREERKSLVLDFAKEMANKEGCAVDVAIHLPNKKGDLRNHHAHILRTTRKVGSEGLGDKLDTEKAGRKRTEDLQALKKRWAEMGADRLERAGFKIAADRHRVGYMTLPKQVEEARKRGDMDFVAANEGREPTKHLGPSATAFERRTGQESEKRINWQELAIERLTRAKEAGEAERQANGKEALTIGGRMDFNEVLIETVSNMKAKDQIGEELAQQNQGKEKEEKPLNIDELDKEYEEADSRKADKSKEEKEKARGTEKTQARQSQQQASQGDRVAQEKRQELGDSITEKKERTEDTRRKTDKLWEKRASERQRQDRQNDRKNDRGGGYER